MKIIVLPLFALTLLLACNNSATNKSATSTDISTKTTETKKPITTEQIKDKTFVELFKNIKATELTDNVFKLVGQDYTVITAGNKSDFNSMTASYGGWGQLFEEPVTWCFLRANRYTLEMIKENETYTMAYFPDEFKDQVVYFGSKTGRGSDKMRNTTLTPVETPDGNMAYKEAKLIIECKLMEITTVNPDDFYTEKGKSFVIEAFDEAKEYHKLVFGQIINVWVAQQ